MKSVAFSLLSLLAATTLFAGQVSITGDSSQLQQVEFTLSGESKTVQVTLPATHDLKVSTDQLVELKMGRVADGRPVFTAVFSGPASVVFEKDRLVFSSAAVTGTAAATAEATGAGTGGRTLARPVATAPAAAQEEPEAEKVVLNIGGAALELPTKSSLEKRDFSFDAAIPESPAASVIGSSAAIVRFNETKDATTQLLNIADANGNINSGFSFAFHPYRLLAKPTLAQYTYGPDSNSRDTKNGYWVRFLSRLDLSLAATVDDEAGANGSRGATGALGLSAFIFNRADTRMIVGEKLAALSPPAGVGDLSVTGGGRNNAKQVKSKEITRIWDEISKTTWNNSYWAVGLAPRYRSNSGNLSDFSYDGSAAWTTLGYGFEGAEKKLGLPFLEDSAQILLHASFRDRQRVADPANAGAFIREDAWIYGAQIRMGGDGFNVFGEFLWQKHRPAGLPRRSTETYYVGFEKRLKEDLWLQVSLGSEEKPTTTGKSALIRTALSYGFGEVMDPQKSKKN